MSRLAVLVGFLYVLLAASLQTSQVAAAATSIHSQSSDEESSHAAKPFPTHVTPGRDLDTQLAEAKALYRAYRFPEAERLTLQFLGSHPNSPEGIYLLGYIYEREKKATESLQWFTRGAAAEPPTAEDLRTVGLDYALLNDYPDAIHWLSRAVAFDPENSEAWYDLGRADMMQDHFSEAEKALKVALQLRPLSVRAETNLGVTYEAENRFQDAAAAYKLAIEWQRSNSHPSEQPLLNLGTLLVTQQKGAEAIPLLQEAVRIASKNVKAHEQLARGLEQAGHGQAGLDEMRKAVQLDPDNARLHYELGQMDRRAGNSEDARKELHLSGQLYGAHSSGTDR